MKKDETLFIGIPTTRGLDVKTFHSLNAYICQYERPTKIGTLEGDSHIDRARNNVVRDFLASDAQKLLFIDSDITFRPDHIERLISHEVPVIGGLYPKKKFDNEWVINGLDGHNRPNEQGLIRVKYAGTGFLCIDRSVFQKLADAYPELHYELDSEETGDSGVNYFGSGVYWPNFPEGKGRWLSEDWFFCQRCLDQGIEIYIDAKVQLGHIGVVEFPVQRPAQVGFDFTTIHGWFDYYRFYDFIIDRFDSGASMVEVGSWMGKSLIYLILASRKKGKDFKFFSVDTFKGTPTESVHREMVAEAGGSIRPKFEENLVRAGVHDFVNIIESSSVDAAKSWFKEEELDFVFVDADHSEEAICADIVAWLPKLKKGGILAGHDADYESVQRAITSSLPHGRVTIMGRCWWYEKQ